MWAAAVFPSITTDFTDMRQPLFSLLAGPHPRSLALRRSKTRYPRAGRRRFSLFPFPFSLEGLPDAEVETEMPRLGLPVHLQTGNGIQLKAEIRTNRTDRSLVSQSRPGVVPQSSEIEAPAIAEHVAAVEKEHGAEI